MEKIKSNDFEILAFYPYPSTPTKLIGEYDEGIRYSGDENIKVLFEALMDEIDFHQKYSLRDNKTTIKVRHIPTGEIFYIGCKDWYYRTGKSVYQEAGTEIEFDKSSPLWIRNYKLNNEIK